MHVVKIDVVPEVLAEVGIEEEKEVEPTSAISTGASFIYVVISR
jgi:hypothetical protein